MLETIRQYSRDRLFESGEGALARDRHLDFYLKLAEQGERGLRGKSAFEWADRLGLEYENLRAAAEWGEEQRPEDALLLLGYLLFFWVTRVENLALAVYWVRETLARLDETPAPEDSAAVRRRLRARARGLLVFAMLLMGQGDNQAAHKATLEAVALERELADGDRFHLAYGLGMQSNLALINGDAGAFEVARQAAEEALALMREMGEKQWSLLALTALAGVEAQLGDHAHARLLREEARHLLDFGDHPMLVTVLLGLGLDARIQGQPDDARAYFSQALRIAQRAGSRQFEVIMHSELAHLARSEGRLDEAKEGYLRLIRTWNDLGQWAAVANQLECLAFIALATDEPGRAVRLLGAAEALREGIRAPMRGYERVEYDQAVATLHEQMDAHSFARGWAEGRALNLERAIAYATDVTAGADVRLGED
jgi:tetratricopeptide (TPR) repeat protein